MPLQILVGRGTKPEPSRSTWCECVCVIYRLGAVLFRLPRCTWWGQGAGPGFGLLSEARAWRTRRTPTPAPACLRRSASPHQTEEKILQRKPRLPVSALGLTGACGVAA
eukprot:scaffold25917_cov121-Isochrysis_galbana.AAC.6